jgi:hypothetical protein
VYNALACEFLRQESIRMGLRDDLGLCRAAEYIRLAEQAYRLAASLLISSAWMLI